MSFRKATKREQKLRLAITGPSGSGKTYTALTLAKHLAASPNGIAVIDTERGSASKYAGDVASFDVLELEHFSVQQYIAGIREAAEGAYAILVIDSLSHAWAGKGGILEEADARGGKFQAWKTLTPLQQSLVDAILSFPGHVIVTMRSKTEYAITIDDSKGTKQTRVEKLGMAPVQRDGMEYEFDVILDMDLRNNATVTKSRCIDISGKVIPKPDSELAHKLKRWLSEGEPLKTYDELQAMYFAAYTPDDVDAAQLEVRLSRDGLKPDQLSALRIAHQDAVKRVVEGRVSAA